MSFRDMIEIGLIAESVALGSSLESQAAQYRALGSAELAPPGQRVVHNGIVYERESMAHNVATTTRACKQWHLQASMLLAFSLESWLRLGVPGTKFLELAGRIDALKSSILNEAAFRYYLIIPTELSG